MRVFLVNVLEFDLINSFHLHANFFQYYPTGTSGARIVATTAEGLRIRREIQGGSGYLSMNPKQQHLGLGRADAADLRIVWPNGDEEILRGLAADRAWVVRQGSGRAEPAPLPGAAPR